MRENYRNLLSLGVLLVILVGVILLYAWQIIGVGLVIPIILVSAGCWTIALAFTRSLQPKNYASYAFGTLCLGVLLIAFGVAWYVFPINWLFSLALVLLALGALAIAAALRSR